jgi:glucose/arabinose dehydrogenase
MRLRLIPSLAVLVITGLAAAACSGGDDSSSERSSTSSRPSGSSTSKPGTSTTTKLPDVNAINIKLTRIAELQRPTVLAVRPGDTTLYVVEKAGRVRAIRNGTLDPQPVLDISSMVNSSGNEQGFLGLAFSPDGSKLYVHYSGGSNGNTHVDEYAVSANGAVNTASRREVLTQAQPQSNHNGGELTFGPDGLLYLGLGDGGNAGDAGPGHVAGGNAQSLGTRLGKILRINPTPSGGKAYTIPPDNPFVSTAGALPEIWSYGLRNPWRFSWDKQTGDLWIGDVGQNQWEEVDLQAKSAGGGKGVNFGWNVWEGTHPYRDGNSPGAVPPVFDYEHVGNNCSVTGGYVYRGSAIPALKGVYLFADYCAGDLRTLVASGGKVVQQRILPVHSPTISSFGQDANGELYVLSDQGAVSRVDPA